MNKEPDSEVVKSILFLCESFENNFLLRVFLKELVSELSIDALNYRLEGRKKISKYLNQCVSLLWLNVKALSSLDSLNFKKSEFENDHFKIVDLGLKEIEIVKTVNYFVFYSKERRFIDYSELAELFKELESRFDGEISLSFKGASVHMGQANKIQQRYI